MKKTEKKEMIILFIKNKEMNCCPITQQTKNLRKKTNEKIRLLSNKYYIIKGIFDKLNFKRDDLFIIGKELENRYKNEKPNIHLQNQLRRMKEALYCWYAEYFFDEIVQPNSILLNWMLKKVLNISTIFPVSITKPRIKNHEKVIKPKMVAKITKESQNQNNAINLMINQEVDSFDFSNINNENTDDSKNNYAQKNDNFSFDKFLSF